jgi:hypothetical protein
LLNSMPQFLSGNDCTSIDLGFETCRQTKLRGFKSRERVGLLQPIYLQSSTSNKMISQRPVLRTPQQDLIFSNGNNLSRKALRVHIQRTFLRILRSRNHPVKIWHVIMTHPAQKSQRVNERMEASMRVTS